MADWQTISSLATAGGTLILAVATFSAVRSGNRSARIAERAFQVGLRPVLMPSRLEDPAEKITWQEGRWTQVEGGRASVEEDGAGIFFAMSLRNVGAGIAVIQGWHPRAGRGQLDPSYPDVEVFRRQVRDLYVPAGDVGFWQGAIRDVHEDAYAPLHEAIAARDVVNLYLLYTDHEGGQPAISRFMLNPGTKSWLTSVVQHWSLDRPGPR